MTTYHLTVNIESKILKTLVASGYNLCFATTVSNHYNVAALTVPSDQLTFANDISWTTSYVIAGTQQPFQAGNVVSKGRAPALPIEFGQVYDLESWSEEPVVNSSSIVPPNAFDFKTGPGVDAAAVISLSIPNVSATDPSPIYISPIEIPVSTTTFTPVVKVGLWFQQDLDTSTMIVVSVSQLHIIDFTSQQSRITTYQDDGTWQDGASRKIDYTQVVPAYLGERNYLKHKHEHEHEHKEHRPREVKK